MYPLLCHSARWVLHAYLPPQENCEGTVYISWLRKKELHELLEVIFFRDVRETIFEARISDSIAQILMASVPSSNVSQERHT